MEEETPLSAINDGETVLVRRINGGNEIRHRLMVLGFLPGTPVQVFRVSSGPIVLLLRGGKIVIDGDLANQIIVTGR